MKKINVSNWILDRNPFYDINIGDSLDKSLNKLGEANCSLVGEKDYGYYYLENGYRFGFSDSKVDEIGIDFLQAKDNIYMTTNELEINLSLAKIHEVLDFLNDLFIEWTPIKPITPSYLIFKLEDSEIFLIFDIYEGTLEKISKSVPTKEVVTVN